MKPALILPIGDKEAKGGGFYPTLEFLELLRPKLSSLGWTFGLDFKSHHLSLDDWQGEYAKKVLAKGGCLVWHPANFKIAYGIGKTGALTDTLKVLGEETANFKKHFNLEALVIHPDAVQYGPPSPDAGLERYNARVTASTVLRYIRNQPKPLRELNEICGGILHIEPVHNCLFSELTDLPTYEAMQLGYLELPWVAEQAGIQTVMDAEHYLSARNFYSREEDFADEYPKGLYPTHKWHWTRAQRELSNLAGYLVKKGYPAYMTRRVSFNDYLIQLKPNLFHIGASRRLVDEEGRVNGHLETNHHNPVQRQLLLLQLDYVLKNNCIGVEVEVGTWPHYSPRSANGFIAKMRESLTIVDAIEKLQTGEWQVDSELDI